MKDSVADTGCLSPDPGWASKNLSILTQKKIIPSSRKYDSGPGSGFFTHPGFRIQGSKRHRILDPGCATLLKDVLAPDDRTRLGEPSCRATWGARREPWGWAGRRCAQGSREGARRGAQRPAPPPSPAGPAHYNSSHESECVWTYSIIEWNHLFPQQTRTMHNGASTYNCGLKHYEIINWDVSGR